MIDFSAYGSLVGNGQIPTGTDVTDADLEAIGNAIRNWCGWHIAPRKTETLTLDQLGHRVLTIPSLLVTDVSAVTDADDNPIDDYEWRTIGQLWRRRGWPTGYRKVKVTLTHGFESTPPEILAVAQHMLDERVDAAAFGSVKTAQLDGAAVTYAADATGLLRDMDSYSHAIGRYRL